jgi:xanthine/CO dehydrogenase XdhC/CoxF family maturation factor
MLFGSLVHALVLGGDYVVFGGERRGNAWTEFEQCNAGRMIVTMKELAKAEKVASAVKRNEDAVKWLDGQRERDLEWTAYGVKCGGRVDVIGKRWVTELKTTQSADPMRFPNQALRMGYHAQLAWYREGARQLGHMIEDAVIVAVETVEPFAVTVFQLTPRALEEGHKLNALWMERARVCRESNFWPAYTQTITPLDVPEDVELTIDGEDIAA